MPCRRFSTGRIACNVDGVDDNPFANASELGCAGRPLSSDALLLPLSRDIIVPESLSAEADLKQAERVRPSVETCSAQKGTKRWEALFQSMLTMSGTSLLKNKCVVILNLTGYIEDAGCAVLCLHLFGTLSFKLFHSPFQSLILEVQAPKGKLKQE